MTETTTYLPAPAGAHALCAVATEDDATPLVRLIGRTLRDAARIGHAPEVLGQGRGTVAVRSHDTPQAATIAFGAEGVEVTSGVLTEPDATVVVDLHGRFAPTQEPSGDAALATGTLRALQPPLPAWREAAQHFWTVSRTIPGIPDVLVVEAQSPDGAERDQFGSGPTQYLMAGRADLLAGVLSGADDFLAALSAGLQIKGTLAQLSVMTAASWKVRFDV
jgi:hypothetical protein